MQALLEREREREGGRVRTMHTCGRLARPLSALSVATLSVIKMSREKKAVGILLLNTLQL